MSAKTIERDGAKILELEQVKDGISTIESCFAHDCHRVLVESQAWPPAFFDLRTGFAGEYLQKLVNYGIRLAGVFPSEDGYGERFREFLREAKRGKAFRAFADRAAAEAWLAERE